MIVVTTNEIAGKKIKTTLGLVRGSCVRAKHIGKDFMAGLRNIAGGEIKEYSELLKESREQALQRMVAEAEALGANAVISMRLGTAQIMSSASECVAYGTAVTFEE
jgi:uncharacterized protein YbjQ (UPF0145 family)